MNNNNSQKKNAGSQQVLNQVREELKNRKLDAFVVYTEDAHHSEYIADNDKRREFVSGFSGSAGEAVITMSHALLWTDGRYFLQAENQLSGEWKLMKMFAKDVPSMGEWLENNLKSGARVGVDGKRVSYQAALALLKQLKNKEIELVSCDEPNVIDAVWAADQPAPPSNPIFVHPERLAGKSHHDKIKEARQDLEKNKVDALVVTALDEIAWLFNVRGNDIEYNPVAIAYGLITRTDVKLYIDSKKVPEDVKAHLGPQVQICPYPQIFQDLAQLSVQKKTVWIDPGKASYAIANAVEEAQIKFAPSPLTLAKALKNETEISGLKEAHLRDAVALITYFVWLEGQMKSGAKLTEYQVAEKLNSLRSEQQDFVSLSFETISSTGPNGAIIHYAPEEDTAAVLSSDQLYLVDSGGQYRNGTTDVTRTIHFTTPTNFERECFTRVLKGVIQVNTAVFPEGTTGKDLDVLARLALWQVGLDYRHGTGHGVGAFLNVHEGPQGMSFRTPAYPVPLRPGMTMTDEPGYYEANKFGIRIENVLIVVPAKTPHQFGEKEYYTFENITMVPIQLKMIDVSMLTESEIAFIDDYHSQVLKVLAPRIVDPAVLQWLKDSTIPLKTFKQ